jgi:hypothetical protein
MNRFYLLCRGLAGYLQDLYRIAKLDFSNSHSYTKFLTINRVRKEAGAKIFIEAGTYRGVTALRCSSVFDNVYTIELDHKLAATATQLLSKNKNVKVIHGDALLVIPELLESQNLNDVLLFLDGHYSSGETACGEIPEPAAEELRALTKYQTRIKAIIIDDVRSFGTEPGFPKKSDLLRSAEESFGGGFDIKLFLDQLIITRKKQRQPLMSAAH